MAIDYNNFDYAQNRKERFARGSVTDTTQAEYFANQSEQTDFAATQDMRKTQQELESGLESSLGKDGGAKTLDEFYKESPLLKDMMDQSQKMIDNINESIANLTQPDGGDAVDIDALVGRLDEGFETTRNRVLDSALAASQKSNLELDAYLGSSSSDSRSAVRRNMATGITTQLIAQTQQGIANLYTNHVTQVVNTILKGAEINAQAKRDATGMLASLTQTAGNLLLGTNSAVVDSYVKSISVANDMAKIQAGLLGTIYQTQASRNATALGNETNRLTNPLFVTNKRNALMSEGMSYQDATNKIFNGTTSGPFTPVSGR